MENDNQILEALLGVYKNSPRELKAWHALGAQHLTDTGSSQAWSSPVFWKMHCRPTFFRNFSLLSLSRAHGTWTASYNIPASLSASEN